MKPTRRFNSIISRQRYTPGTATLLAHNGRRNSEGDYEQGAQTIFLYRTKGGSYFTVKLDRPSERKEKERIEAVNQSDAIVLFRDHCDAHLVTFAEAFP